MSRIKTKFITDNAVTDPKIRQGTATSVIGRSVNSTGNVADIAATADNQILKRVSGVLEWVDESIAGCSGLKNYLCAIVTSQSTTPNTGNGNFELGTTTGWSLGTVGTLTNGVPTGTPTFGSGASGNLSISVVSSGQLAADYSLSYASSAATTQGNMLASDTFYIDTEDQAKVLTWKFYYKAQTNPGNANWSGTSSNSFGVAIYDVTNSSWLSSTANFAMTQSFGVGVATGTCQTNSNTTQLRFVMYNVNATTGAITLYFDDFFVGPQTAPIGPAVTDTQSFTPTGTWTTNTTYTGRWRRVGDHAEIEYNLALSGAPTSANLQLNIPASIGVIDTSKLATVTNNPQLDGAGEIIHPGSSTRYPVVGLYISTSVFQIEYEDVTVFTGVAPVQSNSTVTQTAPFTFGSGDSVSFRVRVPIVGWSSNLQMSSDTDTRAVVAEGTVSGAVNLTVGTSTPTLVPSINIAIDSHGGWNATTRLYTVPVTGWYQVDFSLWYANNSTGRRTAYCVQNGSIVITGSQLQGQSGFETGVNGSGIVQCNAGDTLGLYYNQGSGGTLATAGGVTSNFISIQRISGPAVVAATESVNMKYTNTAGTSIANSGDINIPYATQVFDTHNAYNTSTGIYTCPVSGKYQVSGTVNFASSLYSAGNGLQTTIYKNGSASGAGASVVVAAALTVSIGSSVVSTIGCFAGDTLEIRSSNNRTAGATTLATGASQNHIEITRVGN